MTKNVFLIHLSWALESMGFLCLFVLDVYCVMFPSKPMKIFYIVLFVLYTKLPGKKLGIDIINEIAILKLQISFASLLYHMRIERFMM